MRWSPPERPARQAPPRSPRRVTSRSRCCPTRATSSWSSPATAVCSRACNQLVVAATIEAVAEALLLAERSGVDPAKVREALLGGFAGSKILEVHGQRMLDRTFDPGFRIRLHRKDARIVEEAAAATGTPIPSFAVVAAQLQRAVDDGDGELDHSGLYVELERMSSV